MFLRLKELDSISDSELMEHIFPSVLVNGNWTEWSLWSKCSVSCGKGQMLRVRSCSNPVPENNGANCEGSDREAKICRAISCPGKC